MVQGVDRATFIKVEELSPFLKAMVRPAPLAEQSGTEIEALVREVSGLLRRLVSLTMADVPVEVEKISAEVEDPLRIAYMFGSMVGLELENEQALLEAPTVLDALRLLHRHLTHEVKVTEVRSEIAKRASGELNREQREYVLSQQLKAIQDELGEDGSGQADPDDLQEAFEKKDLPERVRTEFARELKRLSSLNPASPEYSVSRSYLEFTLELPWEERTETVLDLDRARQTLDEDYFGLGEVKQRILEHRGVMKLNPDAKAPILCCVGPPGVGKTSLGQSIARALGRSFERLSLGGMHDEAELHGHRRTYIGAMPGRVLQAIRRAGVNNPVVMLDEVDKIGRDFRGDPSAALLEILDPEQNREFRDNYLDLPFDLSSVVFITTANTLETVPLPLLDRMEVIRLSGYSDVEKYEISKRYLIPRQRKEAGIAAAQCDISDDVLRKVISRYTREAGVRELTRTIGKLMRKAAYEIVVLDGGSIQMNEAKVVEMLGAERYSDHRVHERLDPGVALGLAWTAAGGEVLSIEATTLPQGSGLTLTGQLGDVMQEAAKTALSYLWSNATQLNIDPGLFKENGLHVHVPAGATPKDGPSAGITIATALASLYTARPTRNDTALTGEITLSGIVLPVGGIKEKVLAAHRVGLTRVVLPKENAKDLEELPDYVKSDIEFVLAERVEEVIETALVGRAMQAFAQVC